MVFLWVVVREISSFIFNQLTILCVSSMNCKTKTCPYHRFKSYTDQTGIHIMNKSLVQLKCWKHYIYLRLIHPYKIHGIVSLNLHAWPIWIRNCLNYVKLCSYLQFNIVFVSLMTLTCMYKKFLILNVLFFNSANIKIKIRNFSNYAQF